MIKLSHKQLLAIAVATSNDALAVGVSFAFMDVRLVPSCVIIGCTTFVISAAGAFLGSRIPGISCKKAGILGGLVLIGIGVKLLLEGIL
jgi:putative Mn2+ efflux pump MntP